MREMTLAWIKRYTLERRLAQVLLLLEENRFGNKLRHDTEDSSERL